jgi:hypothetical protein
MSTRKFRSKSQNTPPSPCVCSRKALRYTYPCIAISISLYSRDCEWSKMPSASPDAHGITPLCNSINYSVTELPCQGQAHRIEHNVVVQSTITHKFLDFSSHPPDINYSVYTSAFIYGLVNNFVA